MAFLWQTAFRTFATAHALFVLLFLQVSRVQSRRDFVRPAGRFPYYRSRCARRLQNAGTRAPGVCDPEGNVIPGASKMRVIIVRLTRSRPPFARELTIAVAPTTYPSPNQFQPCFVFPPAQPAVCPSLAVLSSTATCLYRYRGQTRSPLPATHWPLLSSPPPPLRPPPLPPPPPQPPLPPPPPL